MIKNYLIIAFRSFFRNGTTSLINFLGLTVGLVSSFLIFLNVSHELSYDRFHEKTDRIFRIISIDKALGVSNNNVGITIPALATGMKSKIAEVENVVRISTTGRTQLKYKNKVIYSENLIYTEPSFFDVFDFKLKEGDPASCLTNPNTALVTETMAKKIFGEEDPMGKIFSAEGADNLQVTGILKDENRTSHIKFDVVISINPTPSDTLTAQFLSSWHNIAMVEYALLKDPLKKDEVIVEMDSLMRRNKVIEAWKATLQPLKEVHLYSGDILFDDFNQEKGNIKYVQSLSLIAIIILLIASFNYMNLSTARSARRAKEVGLRKTAGAGRAQLILQHITEAMVQVILSMLIALCTVEIINTMFPSKGYTALGFIMDHPLCILYLLALVILLGVISGIYPALILSSFKPQAVLKGKFETGKQGLWLRRLLVSVQFIATFVMIVGTLVVVKQLQYTLNKDMGFKTAQVITINLVGNKEVRDKYDAFKNELEKIPGVVLVATSGSMPGLGYGRRGITPEGAQTTDTWIVSVVPIDENYIPLMGMELVAGENFRKGMSLDPVPVIVNESLVKATGWDKGLHKTITFGNQTKAQVIGVVKDFHFTSLRHKIEPIVMQLRPGVNAILSIKLDAKNIHGSLEAVKKVYNNLNSSIPFEYKFFDDSFRELFKKEEDFSRLFFRFTLLSIFIAILGLFGLAAYSAEQRTKEIGIRITFGATINQLVIHQSHEYTRLILAAFIIAIPVAIYIMRSWLQGFAYRTALGILLFAYAGLIVLAVTFLTISIHLFRAARKNPAETLKYE